MDSNVEKVQFQSRNGHELAARLEMPRSTPRAYVLFAHCFTCSKDLKGLRILSRALAERGLAVFRFDFTGLGESEGEFAETTFSSNVEDLADAVSYLREHHEAPSILVGHSLGGAAVLAMAPDVDECRAVATIGAPSDPGHLAERLSGSAPEIETDGEATVVLAGRRLRLRKKLLDDLREQRVLERVAALRRPLVIFHSPVDKVVGIDHARKIYQAAYHPKSFISLDNADHLLLRPADAEYTGTVLAAWVSRYVSTQEGEKLADTAGEGDVQVEGEAGSLMQRISIGPHRLIADEPVQVGGTDRGPSPYDLLLAGLGACTSMTLELYARRKQWPLEGVHVDLKHHKIHAQDCESCEQKEGKVDHIERHITVRGPDLSPEQVDRLVEIAEKCPVHRTLQAKVEIVTDKA